MPKHTPATAQRTAMVSWRVCTKPGPGCLPSNLTYKQPLARYNFDNIKAQVPPGHSIPELCQEKVTKEIGLREQLIASGRMQICQRKLCAASVGNLQASWTSCASKIVHYLFIAPWPPAGASATSCGLLPRHQCMQRVYTCTGRSETHLISSSRCDDCSCPAAAGCCLLQTALRLAYLPACTLCCAPATPMCGQQREGNASGRAVQDWRRWPVVPEKVPSTFCTTSPVRGPVPPCASHDFTAAVRLLRLLEEHLTLLCESV